MEGSGTPSNTCFFGSTGVHSENDILIDSAVIAGLAIVTERPTDRHTQTPCYSVCKTASTYTLL